MRILFFGTLSLACMLLTQCQMETPFLPSFSDLPVQTDLPDPLLTRDGKTVTTAEMWRTERRPEITRLFEHYMYGTMPEAPGNVRATLEQEDALYFGGKATKKILTLRYGPEGAPAIQLLLVVPNDRTEPAPVYLGLNFMGNHTVLSDSSIPLSANWLPNRGEGVVDHRATDAARGTSAQRWEIEKSIDRGYAIATFFHGDVDPDRDDYSDGIHPHYYAAGHTTRDQHEWGTLAAWAWGLHRAVDYLVTDPDIDTNHIAVMGHSRNGKAALLAGALDERIALVVSNNSGCGGAALSRRRMGETVKAINEGFPHWFNLEFRHFNDNEDKLPLDQHLLIALIAPRPVLIASAEDDAWADPEGEFLALEGAEPVYQLLASEGLQTHTIPDLNVLIDGLMGYHIRPGGHGVGERDWAVFMDFADRHFRTGQ